MLFCCCCYWQPCQTLTYSVLKRPRLRLCDKTDGSFESGPARKSTFTDMFLSFHHYPLYLLSSGCLLSAELQCAPVRHNLQPAICCVPRELQFLEKSIFPICCILGMDAFSDKLSLCFWCRVKSEGYSFLFYDSDWLHCHEAWDEAVYPGILESCECVCFVRFFFSSLLPSGESNISRLVMSCHQLCLIQ